MNNHTEIRPPPHRHSAGRPGRPARPAHAHPLATPARGHRLEPRSSRRLPAGARRTTGRTGSTGPPSRRDSTSCPSSSPRPTVRTSTSCTCDPGAGRAAARPDPRMAELAGRVPPRDRPLPTPSHPDAFDLVIPSLPGYGMSPPVTGTGWGDLFRVAQAWAELMTRLGYERYGAQSTDAGAGVAASPGHGRREADGGQPPDRHRGGHAVRAATGDRRSVRRRPGEGAELQRVPERTGWATCISRPPGPRPWPTRSPTLRRPARLDHREVPGVDRPSGRPARRRRRPRPALTNVSLTWFNRAGASSAHATYEGIQAWRELVAGQGDDSR